jgi:hypothetical protein
VPRTVAALFAKPPAVVAEVFEADAVQPVVPVPMTRRRAMRADAHFASPGTAFLKWGGGGGGHFNMAILTGSPFT